MLGSVDEEEAEAGFKAGAAKAHGKTKGKAAQELADATTARIQAAALA